MDNLDNFPHLPSLLPTLSPEMQLLVCCARVEMTEPFYSHSQVLVANKLDWESILPLATRHGMVALLHKHLTKLDLPEIPSPFLAQLTQKTKTQRLRQLFLTARMLKIGKLLTEAGIPHLHYKGIVLDHLLYGGQMLRPTSDMDILVRREDAMAIKGLLMNEGYQPLLIQHEYQEAVALKRYKDYEFIHPKHKHVVEAHWSLTRVEFGSDLMWDYFAGQYQRVQIQNIDLETFSPEDLMLTLCIHGSVHQYESLKWLVDIHEVIMAYPDLDWDVVLRKAKQVGLGRAVLLSINLAHEIMGDRIPPNVQSNISKRQPVIEELTLQASQIVNSGIDPDKPFYHLVQKMQILDQGLDRLRFIRVAALQINVWDTADLQLPTYLFPIYYILRAIRLIRRRGIRPLTRTFFKMLSAR